jgi:hypothetical protein
VGAFESRTKRNYFLAKTPWPKAADFAIMFRRCVQREQLLKRYVLLKITRVVEPGRSCGG